MKWQDYSHYSWNAIWYHKMSQKVSINNISGGDKTAKRNVSEDSDSDPFGDYSLGKMAAKVQQAKKAAMAASSSPGSQASPSVKPSSTPTTSSMTKSTSSVTGTTTKSSMCSRVTLDIKSYKPITTYQK